MQTRLRVTPEMNEALACGYIEVTEAGEWALQRDIYELELDLGLRCGPLEKEPDAPTSKWQKLMRLRG